VSASLKARNDIAIESGLELWLKYNRVLAWYMNELPQFDVLEFSIEANLFLAQTQELLHRLELQASDAVFFEPKLRNTLIPAFDDVDGALPALKLYEKLRSHQNHRPFLVTNLSRGQG